MKNILNIMKSELKTRKIGLIFWVAGITAIMVLYTSVYSFIRDMMMDKFNDLPPELLSFFGSATVDISTFEGYYAMIVKVVTIIICGYAINFGCSILHNEEQKGSIDYLNSQSVSRYEIVVGKYLVICLTLIGMYLGIILVMVIFGNIVTDNFNAGIALKATFLSSITAFLFASFGMLLATIIKKNVNATGVALSIFFGLYLLGYISSLGPDALVFFKWFSPLEYVNPSEIVANESVLIGYIISICLLIASFVSTLYVYSKKDL